MKRYYTLILLSLIPAPLLAQNSLIDDIAASASAGKTTFNFRYRYESVDQDGISRDAGASTLRTRLTFSSAEKRGFSYLAEVDNVTVIGSERYNSTVNGANPADWHGENHLFLAIYTLSENHKLAAFAYLLDIDESKRYPGNKSVNNSSESYGIEYHGSFKPLSLHLAYARQSDAGDSAKDYDAAYYILEAGFSFEPLKLKLGYEVLEGDDGVGFSTPLATLHKFQGWADKFLGTPGDGMEDLYLSVSGKAGSIILAATYHDFSAEDSSADFGSELDMVATWPVNKYFSLQLKYAAFDSDNKARYADTDKMWLTLQLNI